MHVLSKVRGNVSSDSDRHGSMAGHSCERRRVCCCTGFNNLPHCRGPLFSRRKQTDKATSFPSIKKDSMTSTYLHLKWAGAKHPIRSYYHILLLIGKYAFNLYFMSHLLSFNNAKCRSFLETKLSREFCCPVYYLQDLKYFPKFYGWRTVFQKTRN